MSTSPSVIRRFVEYYAGLDAQPPAALATLYHPDATLSDPFGQHQGLFAIQRYFTHLLANVEQCRFTIDTPLCDGQRFAVTGPCTGRIRALPAEKPRPAGLLGGGHRRGAGSPSARLLRRRGDDLRASSPAGLGGARREAEGALMMTVLITGASSGSAPARRNPSRRMAIWSSPAGAMRRARQRSSSSAPTSAYACSI